MTKELMTDFATFGFTGRLQSTLTNSGYTAPTPIQTQAIPLIMEGRDIIGLAQTGTGKTLAFAAPILNRISRAGGAAPPRGTRALVLAPTRELAGQIAASFETYGAGLGLRVVMVCGGAKIGGQIRQLQRGAHVLVATPGRLIDLMEQGAVSLQAVETLVLDEADQMLDLGFIHALRKIARALPAKRQTLLFSATMPKTVEALAASYLTNPAEVSVTPPSAPGERIEHRVAFVEQSEKLNLLAETIRSPDLKSAIVFVRTKHGADGVVRKLAKMDIDSVAIHGNKSQNQRVNALEAFRGGRVPILVATDIAARGIHIDDLGHVVNYDLPDVPEQFVHRIGRTARAGASGVAVSFVSKDERQMLRAIEKLTGLKLAPKDHASDDEPRGEGRAKPGKRRGGGRGERPERSERRPEGRSQSRGEGRSEGRSENRGGQQGPRRPKWRPEEQPRQRGERPEGGERDGAARGPRSEQKPAHKQGQKFGQKSGEKFGQRQSQGASQKPAYSGERSRASHDGGGQKRPGGNNQRRGRGLAKV